MPSIPGRELTGDDLFITQPRRRIVTIPVEDLHLYRAAGLPCINWKSRYFAKVEGKTVPPMEYPSWMPNSLINETDEEAIGALEVFAELHLQDLKTAFIHRMLAMRRSIQDSVLVVYLKRAARSRLLYWANTAADYALIDAKRIFTPAKLTAAKRHYIEGTDMSIDRLPLVILHTIDTNFTMPVAMTVEASDVGRISSEDSATITNARDEAVWRASLLQKLRA